MDDGCSPSSIAPGYAYVPTKNKAPFFPPPPVQELQILLGLRFLFIRQFGRGRTQKSRIHCPRLTKIFLDFL